MTHTDRVRWTRSTSCASNACVEVAGNGDHVLMRDSKDPDRAPLSFNRDEWAALIDDIAANPAAWI